MGGRWYFGWGLRGVALINFRKARGGFRRSGAVSRGVG